MLNCCLRCKTAFSSVYLFLGKKKKVILIVEKYKTVWKEKCLLAKDKTNKEAMLLCLYFPYFIKYNFWLYFHEQS